MLTSVTMLHVKLAELQYLGLTHLALIQFWLTLGKLVEKSVCKLRFFKNFGNVFKIEVD